MAGVGAAAWQAPAALLRPSRCARRRQLQSLRSSSCCRGNRRLRLVCIAVAGGDDVVQRTASEEPAPADNAPPWSDPSTSFTYSNTTTSSTGVYTGSQAAHTPQQLPVHVPILPWPSRQYPGKTGNELLKEDEQWLVEWTSSLESRLRQWENMLPREYNLDAINLYFTLRPPLVVFRLLQVASLGTALATRIAYETIRARVTKTPVSVGDVAVIVQQAVIKLGPAWIKLAQTLASREDVVGPEFSKVLSRLQDRLPPFATVMAHAIIQQELGRPVQEVFPVLSDEPVAAASLGQVYRGQLQDGTDIAVKVQRPGVLDQIALDVFILRRVLLLLRSAAGIRQDLSLIADEVGKGLFGEIDYQMEAENAACFAVAHRHLDFIVVPRTLPAYTTRRVLTMEWLKGQRPADLAATARAGGQDSFLARQQLLYMVDMGVQGSLAQLLETGVMHGDPHPGNLLLTPSGRLGYLDFGLLTIMEKRHMSAMFAAIVHLVNAEWRELSYDFTNMDVLARYVNRDEFTKALELAFTSNGVPLITEDGIPQLRFGQVSKILVKLALRFRFRLPPYYAIVLRSLATLEGIAVSADPDFKIFASAYPYVVRRLLSDDSFEMRALLKQLLFGPDGRLRLKRALALSAFASKNATEATELQPQASSLVNTLLSPQGAGFRQTMLESDMEKLAESLLSVEAAPLRALIVAKGVRWLTRRAQTKQAGATTQSSSAKQAVLWPFLMSCFTRLPTISGIRFRVLLTAAAMYLAIIAQVAVTRMQLAWRQLSNLLRGNRVQRSRVVLNPA